MWFQQRGASVGFVPASPDATISAFHSAQPRPRAQVSSLSSSCERKLFLLSPWKSVQAIAHAVKRPGGAVCGAAGNPGRAYLSICHPAHTGCRHTVPAPPAPHRVCRIGRTQRAVCCGRFWCAGVGTGEIRTGNSIRATCLAVAGWHQRWHADRNAGRLAGDTKGCKVATVTGTGWVSWRY